MNLDDCSSTHQHWDFGNIGRSAALQLKNATDPGALYIVRGPKIDH